MNYEHIPNKMKRAKRWVCYRREKRKDKWNNVPKTISGRPASHSNSETWDSFSKANTARKLHGFDGISFALGDNWIGFDFDNVFNKENRSWHEPSAEIINSLIENGAYVEFSPSGTGIHCILWAEDLLNDDQFLDLKNRISIAKTGFKKEFKDDSGAAIEFYHTNRILTTTGNVIDNCNPDFSNGHHKDAIKDACQTIIELFQIKKRKKKDTENIKTDLSDSEVIEIASNASNGQKFKDLWSGDWKSYGDSQSSADIALLNMLAFYTGCNFGQMKQLFEQSGLHRKHKGETYLETTVQNAIEFCNEVYKVKKKTENKSNAKPVAKTKKVMKEQVSERKNLPSVYTYSAIDDMVEPRKSNEVADDVMRLMEKQDPNKHKIFVKENRLGRIRYSTKIKQVAEDYSKEITSSIFEAFTKDDIKGALNRFANFYRLTANKDGVSEVILAEPPSSIGSDIINHQNLDNIPPLAQIINHPIVTKKWEIINKPGYHAESQMYLEPSKLVSIQDMSVDKAYDILSEWLADFPFKDYSDICNTFALLITMLIRPALPDGELPPLFIITANSQGAGKSTLAQILSAVIIGEAAGSTQLPTNEEEIRKAVGAELILGTEVVVLDNITEQVSVASSSLASAISESVIRFRILGKSKMIQADNTATYVLTGNNVDANADLVDRACFIRLDTEQRVADREFKTESILSDTIKNREKLFSAVYKIVTAWIDNGKKRGDAKHRSNVWAKIMSGIFDMLDDHVEEEVVENGELIRPLKEFLNNDTEARIKANPEFGDWCLFRNIVNKEFGEESWNVSDVFPIASFRRNHDEELGEDKPDLNLLGPWFKGSDNIHESVRRRSLGTYFRANLDKVFGTYKLVMTGKKDNKNAYRFKPLNGGDDELA